MKLWYYSIFALFLFDESKGEEKLNNIELDLIKIKIMLCDRGK